MVVIKSNKKICLININWKILILSKLEVIFDFDKANVYVCLCDVKNRKNILYILCAGFSISFLVLFILPVM